MFFLGVKERPAAAAAAAFEPRRSFEQGCQGAAAAGGAPPANSQIPFLERIDSQTTRPAPASPSAGMIVHSHCHHVLWESGICFADSRGPLDLPQSEEHLPHGCVLPTTHQRVILIPRTPAIREAFAQRQQHGSLLL